MVRARPDGNDRRQRVSRPIEGNRLHRGPGGKYLQERENVALVHGFVERDVDGVVHPVAEIDPQVLRRLHDLADRLDAARNLEARRVEVHVVQLTEAEARQLARQQLRIRVHARGDPRQPLRSVVNRVEARDIRQQRLRRADVRGRLFAADVLLARLQRHAIRRIALRVHRHADDPARRLAHVLLERREERRMRAAVTERHAEPLRVAVDDVGAHLARRRQQRQRQQVGANRDQHPCRLRPRDERPQVEDAAAVVRRLDQRAEDALAELHRVESFVRHQDDLDAERFRPCVQQVERLRKTRVGHQELRRAADALELSRLHPRQHRHRFGRGGRFVEQRGVGDRHPGEVAHHGLEVEQRLEPALRDLRLIGRIRRVPTRVLEHVAEDHARRNAVRVSEPDERTENLIARRSFAQLPQEVILALAVRQVERLPEADARGDGFVDQGIE